MEHDVNIIDGETRAIEFVLHFSSAKIYSETGNWIQIRYVDIFFFYFHVKMEEKYNHQGSDKGLQMAPRLDQFLD